MADNTPFYASTDPASPKIADKEVAHAGDQAKVQLIMLVEVTGSEGGYTLREMAALDTILQTRLPAALSTIGGLKTASVNGSVQCTVASGQTASNAVSVAGARNLALYVPATFDGTQIWFQGTVPGIGEVDIYDITNTRVGLVVTAGRVYDVPGEVMAFEQVKLVCGTAQATTDTVFVFVYKS